MDILVWRIPHQFWNETSSRTHLHLRIKGQTMIGWLWWQALLLAMPQHISQCHTGFHTVLHINITTRISSDFCQTKTCLHEHVSSVWASGLGIFAKLKKASRALQFLQKSILAFSIQNGMKKSLKDSKKSSFAVFSVLRQIFDSTTWLQAVAVNLVLLWHILTVALCIFMPPSLLRFSASAAEPHQAKLLHNIRELVP